MRETILKKPAIPPPNPQPGTGRTQRRAAGERRPLRFASILFIEIFATTLLVLVAYVGFLLVLQIVFPVGSSGGLVGEKQPLDEPSGLVQRVIRSLFLLPGEPE